jgi:hypothetical protein
MISPSGYFADGSCAACEMGGVMRSTLWIRRLRSAILLAKRCEAWVEMTTHRWKRIQIVAFGTLVLNRRLAYAVSLLRDEADYDARIILRSMMEIHFNYAWMRLQEPQRRANRFLKYGPIERLRILAQWQDSNDPREKARIRAWKRARAKVRHLFASTKDGRTTWAPSWAKVRSFEARLYEVFKAATPPDKEVDESLYGIYRWTSSLVHGNPHVFTEVLGPPSTGLRARTTIPGLELDSSMRVAWSILALTLHAAVSDLGIENADTDMVHRLAGNVAAYADAP